MRYLCVHCDHRWEDEGKEPPRRCPSCMRATGVEAVGDGAQVARTPTRKKHLVWLVLGCLVAGLVILLVARRTKPGVAHELTPLAPSDLRAALLAEHVDAAGLEELFAVDAAMETRAEALAGKVDGAMARAERIHAFMRARADKLAFVPWAMTEPRATPVMVAKDAFQLVEKDSGRARLYPLEVAVVTAALLRTLDVNALVAELSDPEGERAPLDASGYLGYYVVAVYEGEAGLGAPRLFDPYGARTLAGEPKAQVLSDKQVVGSLLSLRALFELAHRADPKAALARSSEALSLVKSLPSVRSAHGMAVLGSSMLEQGLQELGAARQQRPDPARMHNLARVLLTAGRLPEAERELAAALAKTPDYAEARATLALLSAMRGDLAVAESELARAEKAAPESPLVLWGKAELAARAGDKDQALLLAQRAHDASPSFEAKVRFAALLRQAGDYERMRKLAREVVDLSPDYRKSELREVLKQILGPTALDELDGEPGEAGGDRGKGLDLALPGAGDPKGLRLGAPEGPGDPLILSKDQQKLRLRGSSEDFQLKLDR